MNVQSLLEINKNGFVRGAPPSVEQLYNNVFGPNGKNITVAVSDHNFKELMFYHYKMLGKKPAIGLPRQLGQEIFKKLQAKVKKSGGHFLNGKGEKIDVDKAARSKLYLLHFLIDHLSSMNSLKFLPFSLSSRGHEVPLPSYGHSCRLEGLSVLCAGR